MKIKDLFIGNIVVVDRIVLEEHGPVCYYKIERGTILYKPFECSKYAKDILFGGKYQIGNTHIPNIGTFFIPKLESNETVKKLYLDDYNKEHISRRKLVKIINKKREVKK